MVEDQKGKRVTAGEQRKAKLALALKANLKRRKTQSREMARQIAANAQKPDKPSS